MDKTPQIAEGQLVMTMDKAQEKSFKESKIQKFAFRCFLLTLAKAKKFQDGNQSTWLYTAVLPEPGSFLEIHTYVRKNIRCSFNSGTHVEAKRTHFRFCPGTDRQTHRWTDCYNLPPTLGLKTSFMSIVFIIIMQ